MNVLFVLYGDFTTNSAVHLAVHARELQKRGHRCVVAIPRGVETAPTTDHFSVCTWTDALDKMDRLFPDGEAADVLHAWTPREGVRRFVTSYQSRRPTPWAIYHEDNEDWIAKASLAMVGLREDVLLQHSERVISDWTPEGMAHPLRAGAFIGLADAAIVIQEKLARDIPPWVPCHIVMPGVDLEKFRPRPPDPTLRARYGVRDDERVLVFPGGLNDFTRPLIEALARAAGIINRRGVRCHLLRSGPVPIDFMDRLPEEAAVAITELGILPRDDLPGLIALADVFVQPGKHDDFEDLRLPAKLPEFFAMGRPVILPDTNIAAHLRNGTDAIFLEAGTPEEIAERCLELFSDRARATRIGEAGRRFAEAHFDPAQQAARLEAAYDAARSAFDPAIASEVWKEGGDGVAVGTRLAQRLRLMSRSPQVEIPTARLLEAQATCIAFAIERARGLETGMEVRDAELARLASLIHQKDEAIDAAAQAASIAAHDVAQLRSSAAAMGQALEERKGEIDALRASLSWRITYPLRAAMSILGGKRQTEESKR